MHNNLKDLVQQLKLFVMTVAPQLIMLAQSYSNFSYKITVMISSQLMNSQTLTSSFLQSLKSQLLLLQDQHLLFKQDTLTYLNQCMGKITTLFHKSARQKAVLEGQLQKSRQTQNAMRSEVIQLKQLINEAMIDYSKDIQNKEKEIQRLTQLVKESEKKLGDIKIEEEEANHLDEEGQHQSSREDMLEIIQEESEQATYSSSTSLRQFHSTQNGFQEESSNQFSSRLQELQEVSLPNCLEENNYSRSRNNIKSRSKVQETQCRKENEAPYLLKIHVKQPTMPPSNSKIVTQFKAQPLQDISNCLEQSRSHCSSLKNKEQQSIFRKKLIVQDHSQESLGESCIDELSKVSGIEQQSEINPIKKFETPTSLFAKKKSTHQRFKTQPSPDRHNPYNYYTQKPVRDSSKRCERSFSDCKSIKTSTSKEKIKVTAKMVDQMSYQSKRNHNANNAKAVVYLGGKSLFRKFLFELKQAFRRFHIDQTSDGLYLESESKNKQRGSRGTLLLRNGMVYEGQLRDSIRHGRGSLSLNGISIYEGQWYQDCLQGQGYLKSLRLLTNNCPNVFQEASYCGNFQGNRLHGIGTIFLNPKEKIVTKFQGGCPVGELTYYNLHEIEFGVWPSD